jgi:arginyl-tRNA synthetase
MKLIIDILTKKFAKSIESSFSGVASDVSVAQSTQSNFGHYQCNSAMRLSKELKQNPRAIAATIIENFDKAGIVEKLEIAGPGFINVWLRNDYLSEGLNVMLRDERLGIGKVLTADKVVVDFSSPNTAKDMHVGHLRSTIIGDSLARMMEFLGYDVLRLNHVGDWGTSFGMLIAHLKENHPEILDGSVTTDLTHLVGWYRAAKARFDKDEDFKKRSQLEVVKLQGGEEKSRLAWDIICDISRKAHQEVYDLLDVKITERGESFYNDMLPDTVADLEDRGLVTESGGAKCVFLEGYTSREGEPLPLIVQKSDGGFNYATTDIAAVRHRVEEEKSPHIIYVTDGGQALHFKMVFEAVEKAGYLEGVKLEHVPFGLVLREDGKKFRTRSGETESLVELLKKAVDKAYDILVERKIDLPDGEMRDVAKAIGIGAVKYADLSCLRTKDYVFNYDRMLQFEGNTAVFLMYAYVRVAGIKRKINVDIDAVKDRAQVVLQHPAELALGLHLCQFGESLEVAAHELLPNRLADYLHTLAEKFNAFFRDCRVEGVVEQDSRLLLCELVAQTLKKGMELLGIQVITRM